MNLEQELAQARAEDMADGLAEPGQLPAEGAEGAVPMPEAQPGPDYHREASGAVDMFAAMLTGFAPKAADIWTPGTKQAVAGAMVPVMEKYGFSFGAMPPEVLLLIVAGPPVYQSARLMADTIEEKRAEAAKEKAATEKRNGPNNDIFDAQNTGRPIVTRPSTTTEAPEVARHSQMGLYKA